MEGAVKYELSVDGLRRRASALYLAENGDVGRDIASALTWAANQIADYEAAERAGVPQAILKLVAMTQERDEARAGIERLRAALMACGAATYRCPMCGRFAVLRDGARLTPDDGCGARLQADGSEGHT